MAEPTLGGYMGRPEHMPHRTEWSFEVLEHRWDALREGRRCDAADTVIGALLRDLVAEGLLLSRCSRSLRPSRLDRRLRVAATRSPTGRT